MDKTDIKDLLAEDLPFQSYDKVRYGDTDRQGHVNNAIFAEYLETGRVEMLYQFKHLVKGEIPNFVTAAIDLDLLAEIKWPGTVEIASGITKIGNSSIRFYQVLSQSGKVVGKAQSVLVCVGKKTGKAQSLTAEFKLALKPYLIKIKPVCG